MRFGTFGILPLAVLAMMVVTPAKQMRADTVYSNFGPSQTYTGNAWWDVGGVAGGGTQVDAFSFTPNTTAVLTGADLALAGLSGTTPLTVYVESNTAAGPGTILDTLTQAGSYAPYPVTSVVNFACSGSCSTLTAGTEYWLVAQATDPANDTAWLYNNIDETGNWYFNETDSATGPWTAATTGNTFSAFDVTGNAAMAPTPEPGTLALLGSGLLGIAMLARRKPLRA